MEKIGEFFSQFKLDIRLIREIDKKLLISILLLVSFGMLNIYLCTKGRVDGISNFFFISKQLRWFLLSLIVMYLLLVIDYRAIYRFVPILYWITVGLLVLVLIIGKEINGAKGWLSLGFME